LEFLLTKGIEGVEGNELFPKGRPGTFMKRQKTGRQSHNPYRKQVA
jgi:hypothetical protein